MKHAVSRSKAGGLPVLEEEADIPTFVSSILDGRTFQNSPSLRALLLFLWRHRNEPISEYAIATEALGRGSAFSAKVDATVRVQVSRLRQRLDKFYEEEGRGQLNRIRIPLGSHQLCVDRAAAEPEPSAQAELPPPAFGIKQKAVLALLGGASLMLLFLCAALAVKVNQQSAATGRHGLSAAPRFWRFFYGNGLSTRVILSTPVFFAYDTPDYQGTLMVRDTHVNEFSKGAQSVALRGFGKLLGVPNLAQNYTVTSDTFAAIKLVRYLDALGFSTTVHSSADAVLESLDAENAVAIGTWGTLTAFAPYLKKMNFSLAEHEQVVENRTPAPHEPKQFSQVVESTDRVIWPGVIAVLPGQSGRSHLLIIGGRCTSALVSFLTSTSGLAQLNQIWRAKGSPEFYELVVQAEMSGDSATPVRFWAVTLHAIDKNS